MQTVLFAIVLTTLILVVAGVGLAFYLGWFKLSSRSDRGKADVTLSFDTDKIEADRERMVNKVQTLGHQAVDEIALAAQKAHD